MVSKLINYTGYWLFRDQSGRGLSWPINWDWLVILSVSLESPVLCAKSLNCYLQGLPSDIFLSTIRTESAGAEEKFTNSPKILDLFVTDVTQWECCHDIVTFIAADNLRIVRHPDYLRDLLEY